MNNILNLEINISYKKKIFQDFSLTYLTMVKNLFVPFGPVTFCPIKFVTLCPVTFCPLTLLRFVYTEMCKSI